ncbi:MAG: histidine phosphatase family protein [Actinomycetota bacterium]|nr:histidine phosphatase family protein [Actinomycetota bacterium]
MLQRQELILLRHGQSTANASGVWQGQLDFPLSDEGRRQARLAGRALAGAPLDAFYASPLSRAYETAELVAREAGFTGGVVAEPGLVERAGGSLEGTTSEERAARSPELTRKLASLPEEERWEIVGAETDEEVLRRFGEAISGIRSRHGAGSRIVVVSHGGAMRAFLRDVLGPDVLPDSQRAPNASITRLTWELDGSDPQLLDIAATDHLYRETGLAGE